MRYILKLKSIMPQFDISSFNVQLIWLFFFLFIFYFIYSWKSLPLTAFLLKVRQKSLALKSFETKNIYTYSTLNSVKL